MYLQITTRCNMTCAHCCFSCTTEGEDMSMEVVRAALDLCTGYLSIGGGEPTMHKRFEEILVACLGHPYVEKGGINVVTNGTHKRRSLSLVAMQNKDMLSACLSDDDYHDGWMVSPEIREAFGKHTRDVTFGGTYQPRPIGRGVDLYDEEELEDIDQNNICACSTHLVKPNGDIMQCGCDDAPLMGNVLSDEMIFSPDLCCHAVDYQEWLEEMGEDD